MGDATTPIRVFAVDDQELARLGMAWVIAHGTGMVLAGTAGSARQALALLDRAEPTVVTIGTELPDLDGLELAGVLRDRYPRLGVGLVLPEPEAARAAAAWRICRLQILSIPSVTIFLRLTRMARSSVCAGVYGVSLTSNFARAFLRSK